MSFFRFRSYSIIVITCHKKQTIFLSFTESQPWKQTSEINLAWCMFWILQCGRKTASYVLTTKQTNMRSAVYLMRIVTSLSWQVIEDRKLSCHIMKEACKPQHDNLYLLSSTHREIMLRALTSLFTELAFVLVFWALRRTASYLNHSGQCRSVLLVVRLYSVTL